MNPHEQNLLDSFVRGTLDVSGQAQFDALFASDPRFSEAAVQALGGLLGEPADTFMEETSRKLDSRVSLIWSQGGLGSLPARSSFEVRTLVAALLLLLGAFGFLCLSRPGGADQRGDAVREDPAPTQASGDLAAWNSRKILPVPVASKPSKRPPVYASAAVEPEAEAGPEAPSAVLPVRTTAQGKTLRIRVEVPRDLRRPHAVRRLDPRLGPPERPRLEGACRRLHHPHRDRRKGPDQPRERGRRRLMPLDGPSETPPPAGTLPQGHRLLFSAASLALLLLTAQVRAQTPTPTPAAPPETCDPVLQHTFPNPTEGGDFTVSFDACEAGVALFRVYHAAGGLAATYRMEGAPGNNLRALEGRRFADGIYYGMLEYRGTASGRTTRSRIHKFAVIRRP
jgi:hypothetical protein